MSLFLVPGRNQRVLESEQWLVLTAGRKPACDDARVGK
jgi:hypothetical protein